MRLEGGDRLGVQPRSECGESTGQSAVTIALELLVRLALTFSRALRRGQLYALIVNDLDHEPLANVSNQRLSKRK